MSEYLRDLLIAVVGGAIGATIGAASAHLRSRAETRQKAMLAMWEYHRALSAFSLSQVTELMDADQQFISVGSFQDVRVAHRAAYPWAGILPAGVRKPLFEDALIDTPQPYGDPESVEVTARSASHLATRLEAELRRAFPLRTSDWWRTRFSW